MPMQDLDIFVQIFRFWNNSKKSPQKESNSG